MDKHPLAELIHAYAEGATIQFRIDDDDEWEDIARPTFDEAHYQYRIKPEETANKQWKPGENEDFWLVGYEGCVYFSDALPNLNRKAVANGNCFRTKAEAEDAAERVKAALKGSTDVGSNVGSNVGTNVGSPELDGKSLTRIEKNAIRMFRAGVPFPEAECGTWRALSHGKDALIKALRAAKIADIYPYDEAVIVYKDGDGELITDSYLVAFSIAITAGGRSALLKSLSATCTALNQIQKEQEGKQ